MSGESGPDGGTEGTGGEPGTDPREESMGAAHEALTRARRTARGRGLRPGPAGRSRRRTGTPSAQEPGTDGRRDPQLLGDEVDRLVAGRGWVDDVQVGGVVGRWGSIVGDQVAANVEVVAFEGSTLTVRARSTAWATQMRLLTSTVLHRIEETIGEGVVSEIVVQGPAGPHWRKGPLSSGGRGPRDTYG
ncbi:DUF721 domain-containing protein [Serinicoccus kebangsaanensis]|uniref:DUF721 domain-containing protein n=1 Tax=Serinicoccus kebangsaanensis TaxID=2602069 RepID=UPI00124ECDCF|nr:DciA family protein [Serinicoccus kebangsaanensis]